MIGRPAAHTLVEIVRFSFPFGGVPLASLGIAQAGGPLIVIAGVGGVILITWVVFQLGFALAGPAPTVPRLVRRRRPSASGAPHGVIALAAIVVVIVVAAIAPNGSQTGSTITIAAVQGGGEQGTSAEDVPSRVVTERHLEATRTIEPDPDLDMVLWPENVIDVNDEPFDGSAAYDAVAAEAARLGVPFAVGVTEDADQTGRGEPGQITNAQVVVTPDGEVTSRYDKVRRVPFGEYVPLRGLLEAIGAPVDQVRTERRAGHRAGGDRAARRHHDRRRDLVGGVLRRPRPRGRQARRDVHRQPDQRRQLHGHAGPDPTDRVESPARRRDRPLGRAGRADGILRVRVAVRHRLPAHGRERTGRHHP